VSTPLKRRKLKSFSDVKKNIGKTREKVQSVESDRELFGRLLVVAKEREINMESLFEYEFSRVPLAIAYADGSLSKSNKSQTLKDVEAKASKSLYQEEFTHSLRDQGEHTAVFIDHMACVQKISSRVGVNSFDDLLDDLIHTIRREKTPW
jgi:hypothetical protein